MIAAHIKQQVRHLAAQAASFATAVKRHDRAPANCRHAGQKADELPSTCAHYQLLQRKRNQPHLPPAEEGRLAGALPALVPPAAAAPPPSSLRRSGPACMA